MGWQGSTSGIQSLYQFGSFEIEFIDEEMEKVVPSNVKTDCIPIDSSQRKVATNKKREVRGPYRKYNSQQIQQLFDYVIETGMTAKRASLLVGIKVRTGQHYVRQYKIENEMVVHTAATKKARGRPPTLTNEHDVFLIDYYDKNVDAVLFEAQDGLFETFDISMTLSGLHKHLVNKASLTLRKLEKLPKARVTELTLDKRAKLISQWNSGPDFDFDNCCLFIDEAGFNLHIRRNFGRSKRGTPARAVVPSQRVVSITILGAICELGVINVSLRKPQAVQSSKKRKRSDGSAVLNAWIGTYTEDFVQFLGKIMDILDENNMKGRYLVMDNGPIHTNHRTARL